MNKMFVLLVFVVGLNFGVSFGQTTCEILDSARFSPGQIVTYSFANYDFDTGENSYFPGAWKPPIIAAFNDWTRVMSFREGVYGVNFVQSLDHDWNADIIVGSQLRCTHQIPTPGDPHPCPEPVFPAEDYLALEVVNHQFYFSLRYTEGDDDASDGDNTDGDADFPLWDTTHPYNDDGINTYSVALHAIGHALGFTHPLNADGNPSYCESVMVDALWKDELQQVDIDAFEIFYDGGVSVSEPSVRIFREGVNGTRTEMLNPNGAALMCPGGDIEKLVIEIDYSDHFWPYNMPASSIRVGAPLYDNFQILDSNLTAEWDLSSSVDWKTEIHIETASGCGSDLLPIYVPDGAEGEIQIGPVAVHLRSIDMIPNGTVDLFDYGSFGDAYGSCGSFECADFSGDGCVNNFDHAIFGLHYGHHFGMPKSMGELELPSDLSPVGTSLMDCHPNPFNPSTTIELTLGQTGEINLSVYDLKGMLVRELASSHLGAGSYRFVWNGNDFNGAPVSSGVYLYRLVTQEETFAKRMMLVK